MFTAVNRRKHVTKTITARIPDEVHSEVLNRCNRAGVNINYFLNRALELVITGSSQFEFGDEEVEDDEGHQQRTLQKSLVIN
ncbi:hypothetical protein NTE_01369 [Candidatus Nitrososphaera evergladensis SR1]|uniref:Uncharacterized protein n=1 Tax=Candidatus Nitrososphaera evergladensis SR1 TaxID=1459636 RepID=A0A075MRJ6_9ARCH|nr:hypothetical protein NTE_01369 [Candidatus Nitrososphaera evergladensis SR1]